MVEQGHRAVEGLADGDLGTSEAITLALPRELILPVFVLEGEVLRELALSMQAEDPVEFFPTSHTLRAKLLIIK